MLPCDLKSGDWLKERELTLQETAREWKDNNEDDAKIFEALNLWIFIGVGDTINGFTIIIEVKLLLVATINLC